MVISSMLVYESHFLYKNNVLFMTKNNTPWVPRLVFKKNGGQSTMRWLGMFHACAVIGHVEAFLVCICQ